LEERVEDPFEDDLRVGSFSYEQTTGSGEFPEPYHILFNSSDRTMTWTYPRERALTLIESTPIPIIGDAELPVLKDFQVSSRIYCTTNYY